MAGLKSFDRVAHVYDETRGLPPEVAASIAAGLARVLRKGSPAPRLLEVGIGTGRIAVPLSAEGVRITGIDISPAMLARLREKSGDIDVMLAEASRPPLRPASFDGALFVHILHLVPDPEATLRATLPLVRRGGVVIEAGDNRWHARENTSMPAIASLPASLATERSSIREQGDAIIAEVVREVAGIEMNRDTGHVAGWQAFDRVVREAGAEIETVELARWTGRTQGRRMLERLARRDYSSAWQIPDDAIDAVVERVTPRLEELYGGLDREVEFERAFSAMVAHLPA